MIQAVKACRGEFFNLPEHEISMTEASHPPANRDLMEMRQLFLHAAEERATYISQAAFASLLSDAFLREFRRSLFSMGANEGSVWILDRSGKVLVICHNTGPHAERMHGFAQPLDRGLISGVAASERGLLENDVHRNQQHDSTLNQSLNQICTAMVAVPLYFLNDLRGVLTAVKLQAAIQPECTGADASFQKHFSPNALERLEAFAQLGGDLIDLQLMRQLTGWLDS